MAQRRKKDEVFENLPNDEEVRNTYKRLLKLFKNAPKKQLELAKCECARAAFLEVQIRKMEIEVTENGYYEEYQNGANQKGKKKRVAAALYPTFHKQYSEAMQKLRELMGQIEAEGQEDAFDSF